MTSVLPRVQRIAIRRWQYTSTTVWISGEQNLITDDLSHVTAQEIEVHTVAKDILAVNIISYSSSIERGGREEIEKKIFF